MKTSLILACAGKGARVGENKNKLLIDVAGSTIIDKTINAFTKTGLIDEYIVVCSEQDYNYFMEKYGDNFTIALGGNTRTESVKNALSFVTGDVVLIHDGARPFVDEKTIKDCIINATKNGSAICLSPTRDTICQSENNAITKYLGKDGLYSVKTPQGFNSQQIKSAYEKLNGNNFNDDGEVYFNAFGTLHSFISECDNLKITYPSDVKTLFPIPSESFRIGTGFDCHQLVENRKLIIGGVEIEHEKGLLGHSDADVLTHAIMDAILSGAGLRDIGYYFPDSDDNFKGANSIELLRKVVDMINSEGYEVANLSAVIMAQKPKLLKHIPQMIQNISNAINLGVQNIGISATTLEGLGFVGREEGICVSANVILSKIK